MNPTQVNQETSAAQVQGRQLQNQYNTQAAQQYGSYQNTQGQANSAYQNLLGYNKSMANPQDMYNQALTGAQQMYGFNPQDLLRANQALANTNTTMANLPQAVQQQGNYYGTTAGAQANNYASQAGNLQGVLAGQSNTANAFQNVLAATQQQANQSATLGLQGEQLKSQNYAQLYTNAVSQMQSAGQTLAQIESLQQQQGNLTAQQVAAYRDSYSKYVQASAAASLANAQAQQQQMQNQQTQSYMSSPAYQNYLKYGNTQGPQTSAPPPPPQTPGQQFTRTSENLVNGAQSVLGGIGNFFTHSVPDYFNNLPHAPLSLTGR